MKQNNMITCCTAIKRALPQLSTYQHESQKNDLIAFMQTVFTEQNVPVEYAETVVQQLKTKTVKKGIIYLGDIMLKGMGLGAPTTRKSSYISN